MSENSPAILRKNNDDQKKEVVKNRHRYEHEDQDKRKL